MVQERRKFQAYTSYEGNTGGEQYIRFSCETSDVDAVKEMLPLIRRIELPVAHRVNIEHGAYGQYSRYVVKQHEYAGGGGGFIELLKIEDPPDGRCGIVIHELRGPLGYFFTEFSTLEAAIAAFKKYWGRDFTTREISQAEGFVRRVFCGPLIPWFYAVGEEELIGDYAVPRGLSDDPVFRLGGIFMVPDENGIPRARVCMGTRFVEHREYEYGRWHAARQRFVYWDDGTTWSETLGSNINVPRALPEAEKINSAGTYYVRVYLEDGREQEGWVEFQPNHFYPTLCDYLCAAYSRVGLAELEVLKVKI